MKKFSPKEYQGKKRIYKESKNHPRISKLWVWDELKQEYDCPTRGKVYCARKYTENFGKRTRVTSYFETIDEALSWQSRSDSTQGVLSPANIKCGMTYLELIERWKRERWPQLSDGTRIQYENRLKNFNPLLSLEVEKTTASTVDDFIDHLKSHAVVATYKKTRTSFEKELEILRTILSWYLKMFDHARLTMPFKKRHEEMIQFQKKAPKKFKYMQDGQAELFLKTFKAEIPIYFPLALVQMNQLLRVSEVCAMKFSKLNLERGTYMLSEHVIWPRVNGREPYLSPGTKSMAGETEIPLRQEVVEALSKLKPEGTDLIFHNKGRLLTYRQVQSAYDRIFKKAGLPFSGTHVLRHTGATQFLNETGDSLALTQMGNWQNTDMAMHYGKILKERASNAVREADQRRRSRRKFADIQGGKEFRNGS